MAISRAPAVGVDAEHAAAAAAAQLLLLLPSTAVSFALRLRAAATATRTAQPVLERQRQRFSMVVAFIILPFHVQLAAKSKVIAPKRLSQDHTARIPPDRPETQRRFEQI